MLKFLAITLQPCELSLDKQLFVVIESPLNAWDGTSKELFTQLSFTMSHIYPWSCFIAQYGIGLDTLQTQSLRGKNISEGDRGLNVSDWLVKAPATQENGMMCSLDFFFWNVS